MMKKRYIVVPAALAMLFGICVCSNNQLSDSFDKDKLVQGSKDFIKKINQNEYNACFSQFNELMAASMASDKVKSTFTPILAGLGQFVRFKSMSFSSLKSLGQDIAQCIVKCQYENGMATYTILFDKSMKVAGLYIK